VTEEPSFVSFGKEADRIEVRLSYRIIELFSEGLYTSPNKAIEELVVNSFDAGAANVHVIVAANLHDSAATIAVIDDGEGMDAAGLKQHWLIGISNKRGLATPPRGRQQIGKFGIGKLATYVLADRLTHISKSGKNYFSTSMDYRAIDQRVGKEVEPKAPIKIALRELTVSQAKAAVEPWTQTAAFKASKMSLFGKASPASWTVSVLSSLKKKVHEIKTGQLEWVLRTALPLRPDFQVRLNGKLLTSSKVSRALIKTWVLGKDLVTLPGPAPKDVAVSEDVEVASTRPHHFGLDVPGLGRITGYAEAYRDLLTGGKSDELGRSHGFFVYVFGRLLNVADGHFGISPDELRHGTFGRFRLIVHMDGLDDQLRSNREAIGEGPSLEAAQNVLRAVFNAVRRTIEKHDRDEEPGAKLALKLAASPASLSRTPIVALARAVASGTSKSRYLLVPTHRSLDDRERFLSELMARAQDAEHFVTGVRIDFKGSTRDVMARFDTSSGFLLLNGWHPFVATFHDDFINKRLGLPLELLAMADVLAESHLHWIGVASAQIDSFLSARDELLRHLAGSSSRKSALLVANELREARNNSSKLEERLCDAFQSLGFDVTPMGKRTDPDGVARAYLSADSAGMPQGYSVSLEAKSKETPGPVSAKTVGISAIVRQRDKYSCDHAVVVGPAFPTTQGDKSALAQEIEAEKRKSAADGEPRTITLITIDSLAKLVRLRPVKQLGLGELRSLLLTCSVPEDSQTWINAIATRTVKKPPYRKIVEAIERLQKEDKQAPVKYSGLRVELKHLTPSVKYETDEELAVLCRGMAQMAPGAMHAGPDTIELDQSAANVLAEIEAATRDYPIDEQ